MRRFNNILEKHFYVFILLAVIWLLIGPYLFTKFSILDLSNAGGIGSAFSGITSPIIALISAILLYITIVKQIESNRRNSYEANFKIIYQELVQIRTNINNYSYKNKKGKEGFEIFSNTTKDLIDEDNTEILIDPIEKIRLTFLEIGRVLYLSNSLETTVEYSEFITNELTHIYSYYLKPTHSIMETWNIDFAKKDTWSLNRLDSIRKELDAISKRITEKSITKAQK
jgi:carbon starvation protein CstA